METLAGIDAIKRQLKEIIAGDLDANIRVEDIHDDVSLYEDGIGLDSISIVNFIVLIEDKFGISFLEEEMDYKLFGSLNNLATVISHKHVQ